jgi:hypothetical protein
VGTLPTQELSRPRKWYEDFRALRAGLLQLGIHAVGLFAILGFIKLVELTLQFFWGTQDVIFFEFLKLKYLFQMTDLCMLVGFLSIGTYRFLKAINAE